MDFTEAYGDSCSVAGFLARFGKYHLLKKHLASGKIHDATDNRGWLPLHEAAANGKLKCLLLLIRKNKNYIDFKTFDGHTPIHLAVINNHVNLIKVLLKHGADIGIKNNFNFHPLQSAIIKDNYEAVRTILNYGLALEKSVMVASLCEAIEKENLNLIKLLVNFGIDLEGKYTHNRNMIFMAAEYGNYNILEFLLESIQQNKNKEQLINCQAIDGATPLFIAVQNGNIDCLSLLLKHSGNPNMKCLDESLPLHIACQKGHQRCIALLAPPVTSVEILATCEINIFELVITHGRLDSLMALIPSLREIGGGTLPDNHLYVASNGYLRDLDGYMSSFYERQVRNRFSLVSFAIFLQEFDILEALLNEGGHRLLQAYPREIPGPASPPDFVITRTINAPEAYLLSNRGNGLRPIRDSVQKFIYCAPGGDELVSPGIVSYLLTFGYNLDPLLDYVHLNLVTPDVGDEISGQTITKYLIRQTLSPDPSSLPNLLDGTSRKTALLKLLFDILPYSTQTLTPDQAKALTSASRSGLDFRPYTESRALKRLCRSKVRQMIYHNRARFEPISTTLTKISILPTYIHDYLLYADP